MDILNNKSKESSVNKSEVEQVQKEKQEYKLLGTYIYRKGLKLYSYNSLKNEIKEVDVKFKEVLHMKSNGEKFYVEDVAGKEVTVDSRNIHFEALNIDNAKKRIRKYQKGEIKELCNLRKANPEGIKFW